MIIEIVSGSPRTDSVSFRVAKFLKDFLSEKTQHTINILDVRDWELPMLQSVFSGKEKTPETFWELDKRMTEANGFIMVSPEYNGSYTAALKNLFDHFPRQTHKPFGVATTSLGALGGIRASQQMQLLINGLFGIGSPFMLITPFTDKKFDVDGSLIDIAFQSKIDVFVNEYLWLAERLGMTNM